MNFGDVDLGGYLHGCLCATCIEIDKKRQYDEDGDVIKYISRFMVLCPECGNKRCPKATHHSHDCTGSNEPGQPGSAYAALPL